MTCLGRKSIPGPARPPLRDVENSFAEGGLGLLRGRQGLHPLKEFCQKLSTFQQNELCHYFQFFMLIFLTKQVILTRRLCENNKCYFICQSSLFWSINFALFKWASTPTKDNLNSTNLWLFKFIKYHRWLTVHSVIAKSIFVLPVSKLFDFVKKINIIFFIFQKNGYYLKPYYDEVVKERHEREAWDKL